MYWPRLPQATAPSNIWSRLATLGGRAGQLEEELAQNSWLTIQADPKVLFDTPHSDRLDAAGQLLGIDIRLLSSHAGHS